MLTPCKFSGFVYFRTANSAQAGDVADALQRERTLYQADKQVGTYRKAAQTGEGAKPAIVGFSTTVSDDALQPLTASIIERFPGVEAFFVSEAQAAERAASAPDPSPPRKADSGRLNARPTKTRLGIMRRESAFQALAEQLEASWACPADAVKVGPHLVAEA